MRQHKIAIVLQPVTGGVASVAKFIINTLLSTESYSVDVLLLATARNDILSSRLFNPFSWFAGVGIEHSEWNGLKAYKIGANLTEFEFQRYMPRRKLTELFNQYDLVQVVSGSPALAYVTKNSNVPVCLFVATMMRLERQSMLKKAGLIRKIYSYGMLPQITRIDRNALQHVEHVFAETLYTKQQIMAYVSEEKISIDTIGVDTNSFQQIPDDIRDDDYILSVGRFADLRKNVGLLFRAYARLRQQVSMAPRLVLAGESSPDESNWLIAQNLGIQDFIEFKHKVPLDELISLYQNASFFALSSDEEGLGIVLLEAMACATPVISTRCGGPDSIVSEEVGFLIPTNDVEAMSDRMLWMLQNPDRRRQMGRAGRKMIELRFSNDIVGQKYLDVYNHLLVERCE